VRPSAASVAATAWFAGVLLLTAPLCFVLGTLVFAVTAPFDPQRRALHTFVCRWTFAYLRLWPGWRVRVRGREHLPTGACVLVANHQSAADVVAAMGLGTQFKFVSKASLFSLPLVGWLMRMIRYVRLERGSAASTRRMMDGCRGWLRRGMPVLIFPEGTYGEGGPLLTFRPGAFVLAIEEGVPVVPVALHGTADLLRGDGPWMAPRARLEIEVLPPRLPNSLGDDPAALAEQVRAQLLTALRA
jgi:1-acyl-sn-glycerol-3-phosphate acyltransferase